MKIVRIFLIVAGVIVLTAFATLATGLDRGALWQVVHACVADYQLTGAPFPCLQVDIAGGEDRGDAVVLPPLRKDLILVPTRAIVGVEDPFLQSTAAPNYFNAAWRARSFLKDIVGRAPAHEEIALIVNSAVTRDQDQLHIHVGCLRPIAQRALAAAAAKAPLGQWARIGPIVPHTMFWAMRIKGADLSNVEPFRLAAEALANDFDELGELTVAAAGVRVGGDDQFVILASTAYAPGAWWPVSAGDLLDAACRASARPAG